MPALTAAFRAGVEAHASVAAPRIAALRDFVGRRLTALPWGERLTELGISAADVADATLRSGDPAVDWRTVFDAFTGHWVGGDLHDATRAYQHVWQPTEVAGRLACQRVLMHDAEGRLTVAYNFSEPGVAERPELSGLVGERAHLGFVLPHHALLWIGEERDGQRSIHVERVWARGQLYDVRGVVVSADLGRVTASDWRYHRIRDPC